MTRARPKSLAPSEARKERHAQDLAGSLHEVSNALTVVLGWLDVAHSKLPAGPEREALEIARTHARLGYGVARRAIGAEVQDTSPVQSTARAVARAAITGVSPHAMNRGVEVVFEPEDSHAIVSNPSAALQILTNLLLNAIAFTPEGMCVSLTVFEDGANVVFTVRDEGPGIAPERVESLFQSPMSTRSGGAGVGLKHSHALAAAHGGSLCISPPGPRAALNVKGSPASNTGASFDLLWPIAEARSSAGPKRSIGSNVRGARVLVIEDDAAVSSLIELALEARGAEPVLAASESELERLLTGEVYDVALVDLSPIADRAESILARLRAASPGVAIILISGLASGVPESIEQNVAAWVRKPFEMGEVVEVMARLLAERVAVPPVESAAG